MERKLDSLSRGTDNLVDQIRDLKLPAVSLLLVTILLSSLGYPYFVRAPTEQSFRIYLLGAIRTNDYYYHGSDSSVLFGKKAKWHFGVINPSGSVQYVAVRARLGNSSSSLPDPVKGIPSSAPIIAEFRRTLMGNETWEFFFIWVIRDIRMTGEAMTPTTMEIDGVETRNIKVSALRGKNFRIIFELWTMDPTTKDLAFGWKTQKEGSVPWLQMWFNVTIPN